MKKKYIDRLRKSLETGLFEEFVPFPKKDDGSKGEWDYHWAVNNWGTKWDVQTNDGGGDATVVEDRPKKIAINFDTAWCPPIEFYDKMVDLGFNVVAIYAGDDSEFCGRYENGGTKKYDIDCRADFDALPEELQDFIGDYENEEDGE